MCNKLPFQPGEVRSDEPGSEEALNPLTAPERPRVWWTPLLEWLVFFSMVAWIFGVAALA